MAKKTYHVVQNAAGGWDLKKSGAARSAAHAPTKAKAVEAATEILKNSGGGELVVQGSDGRVKERKAYVLTASGGHLKLSAGTVQFVHRDKNGKIIVPTSDAPKKNKPNVKFRLGRTMPEVEEAIGRTSSRVAVIKKTGRSTGAVGSTSSKVAATKKTGQSIGKKSTLRATGAKSKVPSIGTKSLAASKNQSKPKTIKSTSTKTVK